MGLKTLAFIRDPAIIRDPVLIEVLRYMYIVDMGIKGSNNRPASQQEASST